MFGEKQRRIEHLEATVSQRDNELAEIRPWAGIAKILQEKSAAYAAGIDPETAVNLAIQEAGEEQRRNFVVAAFQKLDPERQLEILSDTFGDGILKEALESERQRRLELLGIDEPLKRLIEEGREHGRLYFKDIPIDAKVEIQFHNSGTLDGKGKGDDFSNWSRKISGVMQPEGKLMVLRDELRGFTYPSDYRYADFTEICITPSGAKLGSPLYFGVAAHQPHNGGLGNRSLNNLDLGPVTIDGHDIFGVLSPESEQATAGGDSSV